MSGKPIPVFALAAFAIIVLILSVSGCTAPTTAQAPPGTIKKFNSPGEIEEYLRNATNQAQGTYNHEDMWEQLGGTPVPGIMAPVPVTVPVAVPVAGRSASISNSPPTEGAGSIGSADYSRTNVQVAGIDEPDFVKNDGKYIYVISGNTLAIVDAYPASSASIVSKTLLEDTPQEIFVQGDRLVLVTTGFTEKLTANTRLNSGAEIADMPLVPYGRSFPVTHAIFYDIGDRAHPKVIKNYTLDGSYTDARMTGTTVYLLSRESVYPYSDGIVIPAIRENGKIVATPDVWYFDNPEPQFDFTTVSSFDITGGATKDAQTYLVGSGDILSVSPGAMYISYQRYHPVYYPMRGITGQAAGAGVPNGPVTAGIISPGFPADFNTMSESDRQALIDAMKSGEIKAVRRGELDQTTTVIHKIGIDNGAITYLAHGEVPGVLKNQFAMDEYNGNLRVATTSSVWTDQGQYEYNSIFVLDSSMHLIGSLTHIAEQEKIYSTRFIGDRLYMVTFKRIDPFFVIDLADPKAPKVLGKLKIPGYSDYLHPYDSTHVIGLGKETGTTDWGGVSTRGLKLALFEVTDVEHPKQVARVEIGDPGSDFAALSDHRAFLFDKDKNLLVIPARIVKQDTGADKFAAGSQRIWYGAYVFGVTPESGFVVRGTIEHGNSTGGYYWFDSSPYEVKRSLYIGDTLYTLSKKQILANSLAMINTTLATIPLPDGEDILFPPMEGI